MEIMVLYSYYCWKLLYHQQNPNIIYVIPNLKKTKILNTSPLFYVIKQASCFRVLGAAYYWPGKIRIFRKGHAWVRDGGHLTYDDWSERDFMMHDWKGDDITKLHFYFDVFVKKNWTSPFLGPFNVSECGNGYSGWKWQKEKMKSNEEIRLQLAESEKWYQGLLNRSRFIPFLDSPNIVRCFPKCDDFKNAI